MRFAKNNQPGKWIYFAALPLLFLMATSFRLHISSIKKTSTASTRSYFEEIKGTWEATIKGDKLYIQFRTDDLHSNSSSDNFLLTEISPSLKDQKGEFKIKREAGIVLFNGKFENDKGYGTYLFTPDQQYTATITSKGITELNDRDLFAFWMVNVTGKYVQLLHDNGFQNVSKHDLIPLAALNVDEAYIKMWKQNGYEVTVKDLIPLKSLNVSADDIKGFKEAGLNLSAKDLIPMKSLGISPAYVKSFQALGFKEISSKDLIPMKSLGITAEYVKAFQALGFNDIKLQELIPLKSTGVTPAYVESMQKKGMNYKTLNKYMQLKNIGD